MDVAKMNKTMSMNSYVLYIIEVSHTKDNIINYEIINAVYDDRYDSVESVGKNKNYGIKEQDKQIDILKEITLDMERNNVKSK